MSVILLIKYSSNISDSDSDVEIVSVSKGKNNLYFKCNLLSKHSQKLAQSDKNELYS